MKTIRLLAIALLSGFPFLAKAQDAQTDKTKDSGFTETVIWPETAYFEQYNESKTGDEKQLTSAPENTAVGEIAVNSRMSNGTMIVNIPIEIVPGLAGMTPDIALIYNNRTENGVAGFGWNIGGLYPVTYHNRSMYYHNKAEPAIPGFSSDLCWGGRRLLVWDSAQTTYRLESSEKTVTARKNGQDELIVSDQQGNSYYYKYDNNRKIFYLFKRTDRHTNSIDYSYKIDNNVYYIEKIRYGGNDLKATAHTQTIAFTYENRPDSTLSYLFGVEMKKQLRLKSIVTGIRTYTLNYTNLYFPLLTSVQCLATHGGLSQSLAPLAFEYNTDSSNGSLIVKSGNLQKYVNYWLYTDIDALTGQFSSSGTEEGVAIYPVRGVYAWKTLNGITSLHSNYNANDSILISPTYTMAVSSQPYVLKANEGFRGIVSLNTDDKPANNEIVLINAVGGTTATQKVSFRIFAETGNNYAVASTVEYSLPATYKSGNYYSVTPLYYQTGDFIGDGKERVLGVQVFSDYCADNALYLFDLRTKTYASYQPSFRIKETDKIVALDYDGDGKTDLWHFHNNGFNVYSFDPVNPASSLSFSLQKIASSTDVNSRTFDAERNNNGLELIAKDQPELVPTRKNTQKMKVLFGDINGDGKMDLVETPYFPDALHKTSTPVGNWWQLLSAGDGTFKTTSYDLPGIWLNTHGDVFMHDFNGDGYSDLVCMDGKTLQILHSNGLRLDKSKLNSYVVEEAAISGPSESKLFTIGINSSNHNRVIGCIKGQKIMKLSVNRNETVNTFLTSVKTSHNVKTAIAYKRIDEPGASNPYAAGSGAAFPYENYKGYSWVVSDMNQTFAGKTALSVNYSYNNAVIHKQGLGFCGFEKIITWNKTANRRDTITYDPFRFGIVKTIAGYDQKTENAYSVTLTGNKEPRIRITGQKTTDLINGNVITTDNLYDTYGNLTQSIKKYGTDYTEQTDISYYHLLDTTRASSDTRIGFPTTKKVKRTRGSNVDSVATEITYSANYTLPSKVVEKVNNKIVSQITRQFDPFSNITQEETIPYEATADKRVQTYVYSSNGMLLDKSTDAFGHTTSYAYTNNLPTTVTDYRNRPLKYEYDALGRVSKQTNPDNTVEQVSYAYDTSDYYFVTQTVTGQPTVKQRYNGLHQCVREDRQTFNSTVYISTEYDDFGRVKRVSLPAYSTTPSYWNTYAYDAYDRITSLTYASGKKDSYSYGKNTVTSVIDGVSTTKTFDASGQVTKVTDAAGTITYNLRADGQPASIVAPGNITTSFGYDSYGRQTSIADPSAGTQSFAYDASGNLQKTTNAKGQSVTATYDKYRRIQTKTCPEFTTSYIYNDDNQLNKETSNNGTEKEYTYDSYGRLQTEYEKATYWLKKTYGYANGRVSSVYYESGLGLNVTENYSYSNGYLTEIKAGTTSIWKLTAENAFGQPTGATTGSFNRTYTYNVYGQPTGRKAGSFQNFTYNFTASTGNLNLRKDEKYNMQETFVYDNLDRLTSYGGYSASYDAKGNITRKSDVGDFTYATPNKPYAISAINATAASVASFDQSITYTSFDRPVTITENTYKATFVYDAAGSRKTMAMTKNNAAEYTRYYLSGDYEYDHKTGATKEKLYLGGNCYTAPAVYVRENGGTGKIYYICRDYLGSITHITDNNGTVVQELSYDAWGRLRNPSTQTVYAPGSEPELFLGRGYTGHEHLAKFGLINMNARLYDPVTSRFVSPDPYIPNPFFSQHLNRYSYCSNNPLKYTDPSGEAAAASVGYSTNDLRQIEALLNYLASGQSLGSFNFTDWTAISADDFYGGYGDFADSYTFIGETQTIYTSYVSSVNPEWEVVGVKMKVNDRSAWDYMQFLNQLKNIIGSDEWKLAGNLVNLTGFALSSGTTKLDALLKNRLAYVNSSSRGIPPITTLKPPGFRIDIPTKALINTSKTLKLLGRTAGVLGMGMTYSEIRAGEKQWIGEGGLDMVMGAVGFIGIWGALASGIYFGGKWVLESTGNDFWHD